MKIKILVSAVKDLREARLFYEAQGEGVGDYFLDSLFSILIRWLSMLEPTLK